MRILPEPPVGGRAARSESPVEPDVSEVGNDSVPSASGTSIYRLIDKKRFARFVSGRRPPRGEGRVVAAPVATAARPSPAVPVIYV